MNNMPGYTCICDDGYQIDETGTKCIGKEDKSDLIEVNFVLRCGRVCP